MANEKAPGIKFRDIHLHSCEFEARSKPEKLTYRLELTNLQRDIEDSEDGSSELFCTFGFDLMHGIDDAPCLLKCTYTARYFRTADANMPWDEFTDGMAVAHVVAYVREFVMNLTTRSMLPRFYLDPLNTNALVARYNKRKAATEAEDPSVPDGKED